MFIGSIATTVGAVCQTCLALYGMSPTVFSLVFLVASLFILLLGIGMAIPNETKNLSLSEQATCKNRLVASERNEKKPHPLLLLRRCGSFLCVLLYVELADQRLQSECLAIELFRRAGYILKR